MENSVETLALEIEPTEINVSANSASHVASKENDEDRCQLFTSKSLLELCKSSWSGTAQDLQPYLRGCKWSPDGTCCLAIINNDGMHLVELPHDLYRDSASIHRPIDILNSTIHVKESGLIYDFCWYPKMNSMQPETCCWLTSRQNGPIQMWDAFDGSLRCTYRGFNAVDELEPALSLTFSNEGAQIIAGYKKTLRIFDIERPGRDCSEYKTKSSASCLATNGQLVAMGSWNTVISLYGLNQNRSFKSVGKMHGHSGGVTQAKFAPDGITLVSGARKDHRLLIWDIRHYRRPLNVLNRAVDTNQRIYFDISPCGQYLVSGGTDGVLKVWHTKTDDWTSELNQTYTDSDATYKFALHNDCCNSVSIHPCRPILATGSGQYHFKDPILQDDEITIKEEMTSMSEEFNENNKNDINIMDIDSFSEKIEMKYSDHVENSLVCWWIGTVPDIT